MNFLSSWLASSQQKRTETTRQKLRPHECSMQPPLTLRFPYQYNQNPTRRSARHPHRDADFFQARHPLG